jgi:signal transduction histidine kinase
MAIAIAAMALLAFWDTQRESASALGDFAEEQATLARAIAAAPDSRAAKAFEQPGNVRVLVSDEAIAQPTIRAGLDARARWVRLSREESAALGLPARTSIAGLARVDGKWDIAVVATAQRERDREIRAQWRDVLGVLLTSILVLGFGGLALRNQRKELVLARELAVAEKEMERDDQLVRADKLATLGALATGIAHEVSTPLGVISGRAEQLLPRVAADERGTKAVEAILQQSKRIDEVIRGFLGLARGQSPSFVRVSPEACVESARELVQHRFEKAEVVLEIEIDTGLPRIACEPRLFEQVLVNLLLNACEACSPGGHVGLRVVAAAERVAFVVLDDGEGITSEAAKRATEPFFTTKPEGTGLGLAITNEIVKHHHGTFTIAPRQNHGVSSNHGGTRACVELPAASPVS